MPEKSMSMDIEGFDEPSLLALSAAACEKLGWELRYAAGPVLVAYTPRSMWKWDMEITMETRAGGLTVTSKMIHGEVMDAAGRNQKNLLAFSGAVSEVKPLLNESTKTAFLDKISALQQSTIKTAEEEMKQTAELNKVMNFSKGNTYLTYAIIAANVIIFILMGMDGAGWFLPENDWVHVRWGSNYSELTLSGDWWRLITSQYLHFGLIHLVLNMYALLNLGMFLEPMMGKLRYFIAYTCSGVFASLLSLLWHTNGVNSAGASGAIFGMIGLLFAFIVTKYVPSNIRKGLLQSVGVMAVYSLVYGMQGGIDNAAHIGGLIGGFIIGLLYWLNMRKQGRTFSLLLITAIVIGLTAVSAYVVLQSKSVSPARKEKIQTDMKNAGYKDSKSFIEKYNQFVEQQDIAMELIKSDTAGSAYFTEQKNKIALPAWDKAEQLLLDMDQMNVSDNDHRKVALLQQYVKFRRQELEFREAYFKNPGQAAVEKADAVADSINRTMELLNALQSPD